MTNHQLNRIMTKLELRQLDIANMFNLTPRQVRRWQVGEVDVPVAEAVLLSLMAQGVLDRDVIESAKKAKR